MTLLLMLRAKRHSAASPTPNVARQIGRGSFSPQEALWFVPPALGIYPTKRSFVADTGTLRTRTFAAKAGARRTPRTLLKHSSPRSWERVRGLPRTILIGASFGLIFWVRWIIFCMNCIATRAASREGEGAHPFLS